MSVAVPFSTVEFVLKLWHIHVMCLSLSDIPLKKAVAGVRVGYLPSTGFIVNPTAAQMAVSQLDLMMAGTADAVLMIEGFCDWLSEDQMLQVTQK